MSGVTNVSDVYPEDRMNTYYVPDQARFITDYFTVDFTLEELRQVGIRQRFGERDSSYNYLFPITELGDYIRIAQNHGEIPVGIYPETKDPR